LCEVCIRHQIYGAVTQGIMGGDYQGATHINLFLHCISVMHLTELNAEALLNYTSHVILVFCLE